MGNVCGDVFGVAEASKRIKSHGKCGDRLRLRCFKLINYYKCLPIG